VSPVKSRVADSVKPPIPHRSPPKKTKQNITPSKPEKTSETDQQTLFPQENDEYHISSSDSEGILYNTILIFKGEEDGSSKQAAKPTTKWDSLLAKPRTSQKAPQVQQPAAPERKPPIPKLAVKKPTDPSKPDLQSKL
jgi:hypothetical protein